MCATQLNLRDLAQKQYTVLSQRKNGFKMGPLSLPFSIQHAFSFILPEQKTVLLLKTTNVIHFLTASQISLCKTLTIRTATGNIHSVCLVLGQQSPLCLRLNTPVTCCNRPLIHVKMHRTNIWQFWDIIRRA